MSDILERLQAHISDRYTVERELGRGGMATVYLATDVRHERHVAIKVLHPDLSATIGGERFEREIKLAAKLQHPHILGLIDSGEADGLLFYVMPFIEGESVRDKLDREKQLSLDEAIQITLEVADALGYAHAQGIVHRDIKPENVMMSNGHALVADFGIARARSEAGQAQLTQTGMAVGTPVYMSPEQSTGETVGPSADIYSMGCMLYEMLAGEPPFSGANPMAIMAKHLMEAVPSVRVVRPSVPEEVEEAILASMEKAVADRPKTAAEFCEILGTQMGATATRRVTMRYTAQRRVPSGAEFPLATRAAWWRKPWVLGVAGLMVIGAAFGGYQAFSKSSPVSLDPLARKVAVRYFSVAGGDVAELQPVADRLTETLIRDLGSVRALTVISANGVAQFRDENIRKDSVARALNVGILVEGTVEPEGSDRVLVTARLYDATGANLGRALTVYVDRDSLFTAEEAVAKKVSIALRGVIGEEIEVREAQSATRSSVAWTLFNRAEQARRDAVEYGAPKADSAIAGLTLADSLLRDAHTADGQWVEPLLQRVQVALDRRRYLEPADQFAALDTALARVSEVLEVDPGSAKALEQRGIVKYVQWQIGRLTLDPVVRDALLTEAEDDLQSAITKDPGLVSAYTALTFLYYDKKNVPASLNMARQAWAADEFNSNSQAVLSRLFYGSYDTQSFQEARKWCTEGGRRFPESVDFTICQLWLQLEPDATPDIPTAWQLAARVDSLAPASSRDYQSHLARMIVGGVIGRSARTLAAGAQQTAILDSARRVLERAQGDRKVDPRRELAGYRAIMLAQFGDNEEAIKLLTNYVAANPDHSFRVGGMVHWWFRDLRNQRGFEVLLSRTQ